jgi:hypothetical protein
LRRFYKILFFAFFASCFFLSLNKTADAAEYTFSPVSATPTADRGTCGPGVLNDFTAYISNQSFNSSSGTFTYNVNVKWGRCQLNGDQPATSRAYAIFGTSSLCPNSGSYGENGLAYDCVKYVGSPAYSTPSDLKCAAGVNATCTTSAFSAAIIEQQYPDFPYPTPPSRTYSQSYTIPNWSNVISSSTSYSVPTTRMCQYYKNIAYYTLSLVDNNRCIDMSISVSWAKNYYEGTVQTNKWLIAGATNTLNDPTVSNADITLSWGGQCGPNSSWSSAPNTQQSWQIALWVNPCDSSVSTQGDYNNSIKVPTDYRLNRVQLTGGDTDLAGTVCTDNINKTGTCTAYGVRVVNGTYTYVNWYLEKIPVPIPYYPWLQTKNGDVTSADNSIDNGKITGQKIGSATDLNNRRGARRAGTGTAPATVAESSFVVAATDAGDYFCAQERFVLGKPLANRDNFDDVSCQTGGYTPSPVNFDKVKASIAKAYADNGNGVPKSPATPNACNPKYATGVTATNGAVFFNNVDKNCPAGGIQKIDGSATIASSVNPKIVTGRGTVWVTGSLTIDRDIIYGAATNDPKTTPNLVIFVEGNVFIGADVTQIDASIISMETISTCTQSGTTGPACSSALVINGFLASGGKIDFARRYYAEPYATATPSPAELINLTSQSTTFPAPGLDRTDTDVTSKLQINGGEFAPRLN